MPRAPRQVRLPGMEELLEGQISTSNAQEPPSVQPRASGDSPDGRPVAVSVLGAKPNPGSEDIRAAADDESHQGMPDLADKLVYVVDANSLIFQVFHGLPEMSSPSGRPVNAVYGFTRDMLYLLEEKRPDYLFCAFDLPTPTFRHELFAEYKGQRADMPADLAPQFGLIESVLHGLNIPVVSCPGYEADDVLATIAHLVQQHGGRCALVTADKDCRQLLGERVWIYNIRKDQVYDPAALAADWGVRPDQVVDFQSLVGDAVDNIPGAAGIGPKGAQELLSRYDTLAEVLAHADEIKAPKRRESLLAFRDRAAISRRLVELDRQTPVAIDWRAGRVDKVRAAEACALFQELGFRSFPERVRRLAGDAMDDAPAILSSAPQWQSDYRLLNSPEQFAWLIEQLRQQPEFSFDTETTSISPTQAELVGCSFSWEPGVAYYVPVRAPAGEPCLNPEQVLAALRPLLEDPAVAKVGQNLKYDFVVLRMAGLRPVGAAFDTLLASYLLDAGERNHNLDVLARRYLGHENIAIESLLGTGKDQRRMDQVPTALVADYAAEDADVAWRLRAPLASRLADDGLAHLFQTLEMPLIDVLVELEVNGIRVDVARLETLSREFGERVATLQREIFELAGREFNVASPKQLQQVLFEEHKLPIVKRTATGPSTDAEVLEELAALHPLPAKICEYRQFAKLKGTYVDALPALVHPRTGRVHASFNQVVAATGRLSCSDPNLQNIPIRTEAGRSIRSAFLPGEPGWLLVGADYSQIELRVLAHFSGDQALCDAFARDEDVHARVAAQVAGVPIEAVTSDQRRQAKAVNFGVLYGQSPFGLAKQLGIPQAQAAEFIEAYFRQYPGVDAWLEQVLVQCASQGFVTTILGRRRAIQGVRLAAQRPKDKSRQRNLPERTAINTVVQGSAADLIKLAMLAVHRRLERETFPARMLLQIHDELVFETPAAELPALARLVCEEMTGVLPLRVPLKVDVKSGPRWSDVENWN